MIALVSIVSKFRDIEDKTRPPMGLLYVGGALRRAGYDVRIFHIFERQIDETIERIAGLDPLFVGFSLFTGYPCFTSATMSERLKRRLPETPIVWGGIHPSLSPHECLREDFIDYVVIGEGELTAVELARAIERRADLKGVDGIGYKEDGVPRLTAERTKLTDLDAHPLDWSLIDPCDYVRRSSDDQKGMCFITSRGCPYSCGFCYNKAFHNCRWRAHSPEYVLRKVLEFREATGITRITFDDDHFMVNVKRGFEILTSLERVGILCNWLELRLEAITEENLARLRDLGVKRIFFGWESGSNRVLKLIDKRFTREVILEKCRLMAGFPEIGYDASAIIGFPTETWAEVLETVDTALEMSRILPNVNFNLGTYMPYPTGTELHRLAVAAGFVPPARVSGWKDFDIVEGRIRLDWLPWAGAKTKRTFSLIDSYGHYLDRSIYLAPGSTPVKTLVKKALYHLARLRLERRFFALPFEVSFQHWWVRRNILKNLARFAGDGRKDT